MKNALISIIVPCYNQAEYLDECLQSVLDQTYENWECIIVNDGSPDNTEEVAKKWTEKDERFKYLLKVNGGLSSARNAGIEIAKGEWIQFLDCDDYIHLEKFSKSVALMKKESDLIVSNFQMIYDGVLSPPFCDLSLYEINLKNLILQWDVDFNIPVHCALFKRTNVGEIRFNEKLKAKEDWLFWIEFFKQENVSYNFINEHLAYYRHNEASLSKNFTLVFENVHLVHKYIYENSTLQIKDLIFQKLNNSIFSLNNINFNQKKYIRQLQNTKILKYYLSFKKLFQ